MKKIIIPLAFLLSMSLGYSQTLTNSGFEQWDTLLLYQQPDGFNTTNTETHDLIPLGNIHQSTDAHSGNYSAFIETFGSSWSDIHIGSIYIGEFDGQGNFGGGIPYTQRPTSISVWVKGTINANDSAVFVFVFKNSGQPIGSAAIYISQSSSTFQQYTFPVSWNQSFSPDSLICILASSQYGNSPGIGNQLYIDDIQFIGVTDQLPNNGFENWTDKIQADPHDWATSNFLTIDGGGPSVTASSNAYEGNTCLKVTTTPNNWGDPMAFCVRGALQPGMPSTGLPITQIPESFSFYYKFFPVGTDTALAVAALSEYDEFTHYSSNVSDDRVYLTQADTWTYVEKAINYNGTVIPDTLNLGFLSSNLLATVVFEGSTLYIDAVIVNFPIGINDNTKKDLSVYLSPNPTNGLINILIPALAIKNEGEILITNSIGQTVLKKQISPSTNTYTLTFDLTNSQSGTYFIRLLSGNYYYTGKIIKY